MDFQSLVVYFKPHRDIQNVEAFIEIEAAQLVDEYLADGNAANEKYLDAEGESKVIIVKGIIKSIDTDQNNQIVAVLKSNNNDLGVSCTFIAESNKNATALKVKGVVRSGAEYDEDKLNIERVENGKINPSIFLFIRNSVGIKSFNK